MASCRKSKRMSRRQRREQQLRNRRKAWQNRVKLDEHIALLPASLCSFFAIFAPCFTRPTLLRFTLLAVASILTLGCRTVANVLRTVRFLAPGDSSAYRRVFSKRTWSPWRLSRALLGWILAHLVEPGPVHVTADDTVAEHPGDKVYGKGCHRDAVRSSRTYTAFRWGHKWLVLAVLVRLPYANRHWALPVMVALLYSARYDQNRNRRHKTAAQVLAQMLLVLRRWFPKLPFNVSADGAFASHEMAASCRRPEVRMTLVSRFYADASLYELPPKPVFNARGKRASSGRPRVKGAKRDSPCETVAKTQQRQRQRVQWYGGGEREVETVTGRGHWYKAGGGLVEVRWVFVHDRSGTHRDEYFFSTDEAMTAKAIIETYVRRWNLETTFEEMRSYIGLETTRGWKRKTVQRVEPCLFGMYSVVACLYSQLPTKYRQRKGISWEGKEGTTFSDALTAVRQWLWVEWVFPAAGYQDAFGKLTEDFQDLILSNLAAAA